MIDPLEIAPFEELISADKLVHEPARLAVLTALAACESADFVFLQRLTGLQSGNLSQHLAKLEQAGLITLTKPSPASIRRPPRKSPRRGAPQSTRTGHGSRP